MTLTPAISQTKKHQYAQKRFKKFSNSTSGHRAAILCLKTGLWSDELSGDPSWQMYQRNHHVVIIFSFRLTFRLNKSLFIFPDLRREWRAAARSSRWSIVEDFR